MDRILEIASQYGLPGLVILAALWFIVYLMKQHREERKELANAIFQQVRESQQQIQQQHQEALEVTRHNTTVLTEIATIIRAKQR